MRFGTLCLRIQSNHLEHLNSGSPPPKHTWSKSSVTYTVQQGTRITVNAVLPFLLNSFTTAYEIDNLPTSHCQSKSSNSSSSSLSSPASLLSFALVSSSSNKNAFAISGATADDSSRM